MPVVPWLIVMLMAIFTLAMIVFAVILLAIGTKRPPRPLTEIEKDYDDSSRGPVP